MSRMTDANFPIMVAASLEVQTLFDCCFSLSSSLYFDLLNFGLMNIVMGEPLCNDYVYNVLIV